VIVLDIMLPGRDRLSILRQWREQQNATPVLLLSARGEVTERIVITLNHELRQGPQSAERNGFSGEFLLCHLKPHVLPSNHAVLRRADAPPFTPASLRMSRSLG
jgi:CheY-like chemotaxis protein